MSIKKELDDLVEKNPVTKELKDRLNTPLWASLVISWAAWNWHAILLIVFPQEGYGIVDRISDASDLYCGKLDPRLHVLPLLTALFVVAELPFWLIKIDKRRARARVNKNQAINEEEKKAFSIKWEIEQITADRDKERGRANGLEIQLEKEMESKKYRLQWVKSYIQRHPNVLDIMREARSKNPPFNVTAGIEVLVAGGVFYRGVGAQSFTLTEDGSKMLEEFGN